MRLGCLNRLPEDWEWIVLAFDLVSDVVLIISAQTVNFVEILKGQGLHIFVAMKLRHSKLACHQKGLMQQLRDFWKEGPLLRCGAQEHRWYTTSGPSECLVCCQCCFESVAVCTFPRSRTDTTGETSLRWQRLVV